MAIIKVLEDGSTRVIMIAGEFIEVSAKGNVSDGDPRLLTLSRSSASAYVPTNGAAEFTGVLSSEGLAEEYRAFDVPGNGGSQSASGPSTNISQQAASLIAAVNSQVRGGAQRDPISTSGEKDVPTEDQSGEVLNDDVAQAGQDTGLLSDGSIASTDGSLTFTPTPPDRGTGGATDPTIDSGTTPGVTPPPPPPASAPSGGTVFFDGSDVTPFTDVQLGSFIGTDATGRVLTVPAAETPADFLDFSALSFNPFPNFDDGNPNTGLIVFDGSSGANDSIFGALSGFAFSDLDQNFHFYVFEADEGGVTIPGAAFFGDRGSQFGFLPSNADRGGDRGTQNVVEVFNPLNFGFGGDAAEQQALIVGNPGVSGGRFSRGSGQRMLFAQVKIGEDPLLGTHQSDFTVYATPRDSSELGVSFTGNQFNSSLDGTAYFTGQRSLGTISDVNGSTVYGSDANYLIFAGVSGDQRARQLDYGVIQELGQAAQPDDFSGGVLVRDAAASGLVRAAPLAEQNLIQTGFSRPVFDGSFDVGAISGFAICSTGNCGEAQPTGQRIGGYALHGAFGNGIRLDFDLGVNDVLDRNDIRRFNFDVSDNGLSVINGPSDQFSYSIPVLAFDRTAYADDNRFVVALESFEQVISGQTIPDNTASLMLASSGLAGDGDFAAHAGLNTQPEFARWGWWSSRIDSADEGVARQDLIHLGNWVTGIAPELADLRTSGVVGFDGIAVGTEFDVALGAGLPVGGTFSLAYDFGLNRGDFDLNIGSVSLTTQVIGEPADRGRYSADQASTASRFSVTGGFFEGNGNAAAATGGEFRHTALGTSGDVQRQTVGIFVGDAR